MAYFSRLFSHSVRSWSKTFSQGRIPLALMTCLIFSSGIWLWFVSLKLDINWFWFYHNQESSYSTLPIQVVCWTRVPYEAAVNDPSHSLESCLDSDFFLCPMPLKWRSLLIQQSFLAPRRPGVRKDGCIFRIDMTRITCFPDAEIQCSSAAAKRRQRAFDLSTRTSTSRRFNLKFLRVL